MSMFLESTALGWHWGILSGASFVLAQGYCDSREDAVADLEATWESRPIKRTPQDYLK